MLLKAPVVTHSRRQIEELTLMRLNAFYAN